MSEPSDPRRLSPWKGAIAGGAVVFIVQAVAWMALPFHGRTVHSFTDSAPVVHAVEANAPTSGVYIVANDPKGQKAPTDPFVFVSYYKRGWGPMGRSMALDFLVLLIGAYLWTWMLDRLPHATWKDSAAFGLAFGLAVGMLGALPNSVWWKFPWSFSLLYVVDSAIAWSLASVAVANCPICHCGSRG